MLKIPTLDDAWLKKITIQHFIESYICQRQCEMKKNMKQRKIKKFSDSYIEDDVCVGWS